MVALKVFAFGLRGASAAAKFLLVMYIAFVGASELLGQVAIITTIVALFTKVAGLEINQVVGRRLHGLNAEELIRTLRGQTVACLGAYAILIPIVFLVYPELLFPHWLCVGLILILEHFITEVYRLNILMLRPVFASGLLFVKNAGWVILFVALTAVNRVPLTFALLLYCWAGVLVLTAAPLLMTAWRHQQHEDTKISAACHKVPGLVKEALPFIVSAVFTASIGAVDKLMIGKYFPISELGIFFFFATCASILTLVVTFSVGATSGPECIKVHTMQGQEAFFTRLPHLKRQYRTVILTTTILILAFAYPLLAILNKQTYANNFDVLVLLVVSAGFVALCDPYKLEEYLSKRDISLLIGNAFHLISLIIAVIIGIQMSEINIIATGVMLSSVATFVFFYVQGPRRVAFLLRLQQ